MRAKVLTQGRATHPRSLRQMQERSAAVARGLVLWAGLHRVLQYAFNAEGLPVMVHTLCCVCYNTHNTVCCTCLCAVLHLLTKPVQAAGDWSSTGMGCVDTYCLMVVTCDCG